jgi:BclB C-terminal domain-containing protein
LVLGLGTATIRAELWSSPSPLPDNIFTPTGAFVDLPAFSGLISVGDTVSDITTGLAIPVTPETRLLMVFTVTTTGLTFLATIEGYASAGVTIV